MTQVPATQSALQASAGTSKRGIFAWALWDWGTQPFYTVITTFVFATYITSESFAQAGDINAPTVALGWASVLGGLFIALLAPALGQLGERNGHLVRDLRYLTWGICLFSAALFFVAPQPAYLWLGLALLVIGTVVAEIAQVNNNALISRVANEKNVGKVSGFGWGMGYIGGILVLLVILTLLIQPEVGLFGITEMDMRIRVSMILCGIWTFVFTIPIFVSLRDAPVSPQEKHESLFQAYPELIRTVVRLWKTQRHTAYFLLASALFRDGLAAVFSFGAVIAARSFGFDTTQIILFGAAANLIAGVVTILFGLLDDWIGSKKVILICLGILTLGAVITFALHKPGYALTSGMPGYDPAISAEGQSLFWILGLILSAFCGPAQAAGRSFLARVVPEGQSGEIFGLYATTGRAISFVSPALFTLLVMLGAALSGDETEAAQHWGLLGIAACLLAGFIVLLPVKEKQN